MMAVKCKRIVLTVIALSCMYVSANAQVYISDYKINKTTKCLFSSYETTMTTYRDEGGDIFVEEFRANIEFPENNALDAESEKDIKEKITQIIIGKSYVSTPNEILNEYISKSFLSKYETHKIFGDNECNSFIANTKSKSLLISDEMLWEPSAYEILTGKLICQTNMFISYSVIVESCNAMTCLRKETTFVYDIIHKKFLKESDFVLPEKLEAYTELIKNTMTREQKIAYNKQNINSNGNFYIDDNGLTYVFNSDKYLDEFEATIHVLLDAKLVRQQVKSESIVYKYFNIGQVERAKAKKQNKTVAIN
ncbi:MAG: hypothetical protein J6W06_01620 [Bacteroidales bacterium]|nr:hypothetical protein [Bacteroidales bacterium]